MYSKKSVWILITIALLVTSGFLVTIGNVNAANPTILVDPATTIGDLAPPPGSAITISVKAANIPYPGLWGHEFYMALDKKVFPEVVPVTNMNFTADATGWTTPAPAGTGTGSSGWNGADGNPLPGSGVGSYRLRANSTAGALASLTFLTDSPSFTWTIGALPQDGAMLSFAYRITGNNILGTGGVTVGISIVKPDLTTQTLITSKTYSAPYPGGWFYNFTTTTGNAFTQSGTYKLRLRTVLKTATIGVTNYAQVNWDDIGLRLAPVTATEGSFLKQQPPVVPLSNMNFTASASSWTTTQTGTGTPTSGWDGTGGNPAPGSGAGSLKLRATSTAGATADMQFVTNQSFSWSSGQPLNAYFSYAFNATGNSFFPTESRRSPSVSGTGTWATPNNAWASDGAYASSSTNAASQIYQSYGFNSNIPVGATITKVEVGLEAFTTTNWGLNITVSWDAGVTWSLVQPNLLQTSDPNAVLWNDFTSATSWTSTKLSDGNFRVRIFAWQTSGGAGTVNLDWLPARVTWKSSSVDVRIVRPDSSAISLLNSIPFNATQPWTYLRTGIISPTVFNLAGTYQIQLVTDLRTNAIGTGNYVQVNWDDVGLMLLIAGGAPSTYWSPQYKRYATNNTLYCAGTMIGTPFVTATPVVGGGTLATVKVLVGYGVSHFDLYNTILTTVGLPPGYPPIPLAHVSADGYFDNRIPGDISGPENPPSSGLYPYDSQVSIYDLNYLGKAFGTGNATADFTGPENPGGSGSYPPDGIVDVRDLHKLGKNYGRHYP